MTCRYKNVRSDVDGVALPPAPKGRFGTIPPLEQLHATALEVRYGIDLGACLIHDPPHADMPTLSKLLRGYNFARHRRADTWLSWKGTVLQKGGDHFASSRPRPS